MSTYIPTYLYISISIIYNNICVMVDSALYIKARRVERLCPRIIISGLMAKSLIHTDCSVWVHLSLLYSARRSMVMQAQWSWGETSPSCRLSRLTALLATVSVCGWGTSDLGLRLNSMITPLMKWATIYDFIWFSLRGCWLTCVWTCVVCCRLSCGGSPTWFGLMFVGAWLFPFRCFVAMC